MWGGPPGPGPGFGPGGPGPPGPGMPGMQGMPMQGMQGMPGMPGPGAHPGAWGKGGPDVSKGATPSFGSWPPPQQPWPGGCSPSMPSAPSTWPQGASPAAPAAATPAPAAGGDALQEAINAAAAALQIDPSILAAVAAALTGGGGGGGTGSSAPAPTPTPAPAAPTPAQEPPSASAAAGGDEGQMAVMAAAQSAQHMQYMQQYQFYQQLQVQEAQRRAKTQGTQPSRFKEGFRPMRICKHLITLGICRQGPDCTFAHTYDELHPASPDLPKDYASSETGMLAEQSDIPENQVPDMRLKKKKEMCGRFSRGECSLGKICPFAHTEAELGTIGLSVCGKVKTRLCVFWDPVSQTAKGCIYGRNCNNAHGEREIGTKRPPPELAPPMKRRRDGESVIRGRE